MPPAAKHFDPLVGIDVHIIQPPGPVPPVPVPHPYTGMLMDPCDYAPVIGGTVKVGGLQRAQAGTGGVSIPKHIPIGGVFVKPPADESEMFMGSSTVAADGDAFSYLGLPALSCQCVGMPPIPRKKGSTPKTFVLPTTVCLSIPLPVSVGGSPTVSLMALGMKAGLAALGALAKKVKKARKAKKAKGANGAKCTGADPVDIITGAVYDDVIDARAAAPRMFQWSRHYTTERAKERGVLGFGFRHGYAHVLRTDTQAVTYSPPSGHDVAFEPLVKVGEQCTRFGFVLTRIDVRHYELRDRDRPRMIFERIAGIDRARLVKIEDGRRWIDLRYDAVDLERLVAVRESGPEGTSEYLIEHDTAGRIVAVHEQRSSGRTRIAAYAYDKRGDLFAALDAAGGERRYGYDDRHRWISRTDPTGTGGFTYTWAYDAAGRCVLADSQDGLWRTRFAYDAAKRTTTVTEPSGGVYLYEYDEQGTLLRRTDPDGGVLAREVADDDGRVLVEIDSGGRAMRWLYDERGGHVARADRFGHQFPPEVEAPKLPDPLAHRMPETPRAWWLGTREGPRQPAGAIAASLPTAIVAACPLQPQVPEQWTIEYDGLGRPIREIDAQGRARTLVRDRAGVVTQRTDRDGCTTRTKTVSWNLVGTTLDGLGHATRMSYNATEQLAELVDPKGGTSRFGYDAKDRLTSITRHGRVRETYHYDVGDQLVEKRDGDGNVLLTLTYGADTLLATRTLASGEQQRFAHDARGAITEASTDLHEVRMASREDGGPLFDRRDGVGVEHVWVGARVRRTHVLGRFVTRYHHDRSGTTTITDPTGTVHRLRHGAEGVTVREHAPGRRELSRFSAEGRCEARIGWSVDHADAGPEWSRRWVYSAEGDLLEAHDGASTRFTIDAAHRLVASDGPHGHADFVLDAAGNVEQKPGLVGVVLDEGNRLRFANGETFGYDLRNSITTRTAIDGTHTTYRYDSLDRLVRIDDADPRGPWTATYDAIGRRIAAGRGERRTQFWYDGDRIAAEQDPDGRVRVYVYAAEDSLVPLVFVDYDGIDADPKDGRVHTVFVDHLGMPLLVENHRGLPVWRAAKVDPYGAVEVDRTSSIHYDLRWPGHYFDRDTGLHYNRHRYYDPVLGRYLQSDPLGIAGGDNLYAYASNPLVHVDLLGLHAKPDKPAKPKDGKSPSVEDVKRGEVSSYKDLKKREVPFDNLEHDHIPSFAAVRDEMARQKKRKLTPGEEAALRNNLTAAEVDVDVHKAGRTHGSKNRDPVKRAEDGADLKSAAQKDMDAHRDNLKKKGMTDDEIDAMEEQIHKRNQEKGVYDKPLPDSLLE